MNFTLVSTACPVCGSDNPRAAKAFRLVRRRSMPVLRDWLDRDLTVATCGDCGHHYLNPAPDEASFEAYYADDYFSADDTSPANQEPTLTAADRFFFRTCRMPPVPAGRLLDVGCGNRKYLLWCARQGYEAEGFDRRLYPAAAGSEALTVRTGDFLDNGMEAEGYDLITLWWMLENVPRPVEILRECHRLLRPGGHLLVGVTNYGSPDARFWGSYWHHLVLPEHLSHFTPASLSDAVARAGFAKSRIRHHPLSFDSLLSAGAWVEHRLGVRLPVHSTPARLASLPFGFVKAFLRCSGNITALARKDV